MGVVPLAFPRSAVDDLTSASIFVKNIATSHLSDSTRKDAMNPAYLNDVMVAKRELADIPVNKAFKSILDFYYGTAKYWDTLFISPPYAILRLLRGEK